ncbi:hypothetical protein BDV26DRAFT_268403 [Aspergillus bertholletiae]|uniref:Uncharacterized protein n=1 Tax=Aspergillus bertholletiae TaxID=1226010 RepID=A0A5N7AZG6_9EURO|nr:hypothetical protein BDV26DRAFT_268403 [Aspergillus bertholletiae]
MVVDDNVLADEEMKEGWRRRVGGGICSKRRAGGDLMALAAIWVALAYFPFDQKSARKPAHHKP